MIAQSGSCFLIEIDICKQSIVSANGNSNISNLQSPPGFQPLRSQIVSRSEYSHYEEDEPERYNEKELVSSQTSSLKSFAPRPRPQMKPTNPQPLPKSPVPSVVAYHIGDVMLNRCLYAGAAFEDESVLNDVNTHCKEVMYSKSDSMTMSLVAKSLSTLKSINLIILDMDPEINPAPAILMGKLRRMGYCGFSILLADVSLSPDTSDRFLRCGGDGILFKPVTNRRAVHRILIGMCLFSFCPS